MSDTKCGCGKKEKVETTMACAAFSEEGVECPIGEGGEAQAKTGKETVAALEQDFACVAFREEGVECPEPEDPKKG